MNLETKIALGSLIIAAFSFVVSQIWLLWQNHQQDKRSSVKLRVFQILGDRSLSFDEIHSAYRHECGRISQEELSKTIYEMLRDKTAYYEHDEKYRARWRNPKEKRKRE